MVMSHYYSFIAVPTQPPTHSWSHPQPSAHPAWSYPLPPSTLTSPSYTSPYPSPQSQVDMARTLPPCPSAPGPLERPPPTVLQGAATFVCRSFQAVPVQPPSLVHKAAGTLPKPVAPSMPVVHPRSSLLPCPSQPSNQALSPLVVPTAHPPITAFPAPSLALTPFTAPPATPCVRAATPHILAPTLASQPWSRASLAPSSPLLSVAPPALVAPV